MNEIVWVYGLGGSSRRYFSKKHDIILAFNKTRNYFFRKPTTLATSQKMKGKRKGCWTYGMIFHH